MLDVLEPRRLFAGTVTVTTDYGPDHRMLVQSDDDGSEIRMRSVFSNGYEEELAYNALTVYGGRLIVDGVEVGPEPDGSTSIASAGYGNVKLYSVGNSPIFDLGDGNDVLLIEGDWDNAFGDVDVRTGRGNDRITADGGFSALSIDSGHDNDRVTVRGNTYSNPVFYGVDGVVGDLEIATGQGKDRILLTGDESYDRLSVLRIGGRLRISDNAGPTQVSIAGVRVKRAATIALNRFNDTVTVSNSVFSGETRFLTRDGNDVVRFRNVVAVPDIATALQLGPGGDTFTAERYYDDFTG